MCGPMKGQSRCVIGFSRSQVVEPLALGRRAQGTFAKRTLTRSPCVCGTRWAGPVPGPARPWDMGWTPAGLLGFAPLTSFQ